MNYKELTESITQQTFVHPDDSSIILLGGEGVGIDYSDAFVGIVDEKCIEIACRELSDDDGSASYLEGLEWFEYNTVRAISYQSPENSPLFLNKIDSDDEV